MPGFYRRTVGLLGFRCTVALLSFSLIGLVAIGLADDETGEAERRIASKLEIVRKDFRAFLSACARMGVDNCGTAYPVDTSFRLAEQPSTFLTFETDYPAWKAGNPNVTTPGPLTTPVAYLDRLPADPFRDEANYGYFKQPRPPNAWGIYGIVHSPGPDGIDDLSLKELRSRLEFYYSHFPKSPDWYILPAGERAMLRAWIDPHLYDPTNGVDSRGDLIMVMGDTSYGFGVKAEWAAGWLEVQPSTAAFDDAVNNLANVPRYAPLRARPGVSASIPVELLAVLGQTGVVDDMKNTTPTVKQDRLNELKNRLASIPNFFHDLALSNQQQQEELDQWRADDPRWWDGMRSLPPGRQSVQSVSMPVFEIYPTLVIYGRSQMLQAATEVNAGDKETAARRLLALDETMESIRGQMPYEKMEPYAWNVHRSLGAMIGRMKVKSGL